MLPYQFADCSVVVNEEVEVVLKVWERRRLRKSRGRVLKRRWVMKDQEKREDRREVHSRRVFVDLPDRGKGR